MAVHIRLKRTGAKNAASFRVVASDSRSPRDGRFIEILGWYDPKMTGENFKIKLDRIDHWVKRGAAVSDTVKSLMKRVGEGAATPVAAPVAAPISGGGAEQETAAAVAAPAPEGETSNN
jgi:small subunit ribosomal protein S16